MQLLILDAFFEILILLPAGMKRGITIGKIQVRSPNYGTLNAEIIKMNEARVMLSSFPRVMLSHLFTRSTNVYRGVYNITNSLYET